MLKMTKCASPAKMASTAVVGHSGTKPPKNGVAPRTSQAIKAGIIAAHMAGKSNRQIAKEFNKCTTTVGRVVNALSTEDVFENSRQRIWGMVDLALESLEYALSEEEDARVAVVVLKSLGVLNFGNPAKEVPGLEKSKSVVSAHRASRDPLIEEKNRKVVQIDSSPFSTLARCSNI